MIVAVASKLHGNGEHNKEHFCPCLSIIWQLPNEHRSASENHLVVTETQPNLSAKCQLQLVLLFVSGKGSPSMHWLPSTMGIKTITTSEHLRTIRSLRSEVIGDLGPS